MYLSDIFKFTQGLGQRGHQIGRKVGDAIELLTLGMIHLDSDLSNYLQIEDGIEGATSAKHKVEFSFYPLNQEGKPSRISRQLFGIIECKKVGVEQTIKQSFKLWKGQNQNKLDFYRTTGYAFTISPSISSKRWIINITGETEGENNIKISISTIQNNITQSDTKRFSCNPAQQILIVVDDDDTLHVLGPNQKLSEIPGHILKCVIVEIKKLNQGNIVEINVNESLPGPQTPEKAKQASFVSLDVRKKVLGHFDKTDDKSFISIVVIGEASHWEEKSRSMIKLCNDYNLFIPDKILVYLFNEFERKFGNEYQNYITKSKYREQTDVKKLVSDIIQHFDNNVLTDMATGKYVKFGFQNENGGHRLKVIELTNNDPISLPDEISGPDIPTAIEVVD